MTYSAAYRHGYDAGTEYPWPAQWRTLYTDGPSGLRRVTGHGTMNPAEVAGWMRGFRHACMDRVAVSVKNRNLSAEWSR